MARRRKWPAKNTVVAVHWLDAVMSDEQGARPMHAVTFGLLTELNEEKKYITVAGEVFEDGDGRLNTSIPLGMVRSIEVVKIKLPDELECWKSK